MRQGFRSTNFTDEHGNPSGGVASGCGFTIAWQNGPLGRGADRKEPNGALVEDVIGAAQERLKFYQESRFACAENESAIKYLQHALDVLANRTARREAEGVEGTYDDPGQAADKARPG